VKKSKSSCEYTLKTRQETALTQPKHSYTSTVW